MGEGGAAPAWPGLVASAVSTIVSRGLTCKLNTQHLAMNLIRSQLGIGSPFRANNANSHCFVLRTDPADTLKARLQVQGALQAPLAYRNTVHAFRQVPARVTNLAM